MIFSVKNSSPVIIQTQSRTKGCRTALNGGSTSVCTSTESATRSCNTNGCREFYPYNNQSGWYFQHPSLSKTFNDELFSVINLYFSCGSLLAELGRLGQLQ